MWRMCGVATWIAAWRSAAGVFSPCASSARVSRAPKLPFALRNSPIPLRETSTLGLWWRRFMFGTRSVPPAISIARGPSPARIFAASATERGARYSNHGSRSMALRLVAVAAFPGRQHERRLGIRHGGKAAWADAPVFLVQGAQHLVRRDRDFIDSHAKRVMDRVRQRRHHRQQRPLPDFLRAVGGVRIAHPLFLFDQRHLDFRHVE